MEIKYFENGFEYIEIKNSSASAKIALQGAHVFEYKRRDAKEFLWLSEESDFTTGKAIRGGIPICWPSFGMNNPQLPQHGFARTARFEFISCKDLDANTTELRLHLEDTFLSRELWDYHFCLEVKITISDTLNIELQTKNLDTKEMQLTQAFHTYFKVSDIKDVEIKGLEHRPYLDALQNKYLVQNAAININEEFDNVYQEVDYPLVLEDKKQSIKIDTSGSKSVVVWNPWIEKCKRMSAMNEDAYKKFVCIESANAFTDQRVLKQNETHSLKVKYEFL